MDKEKVLTSVCELKGSMGINEQGTSTGASEQGHSTSAVSRGEPAIAMNRGLPQVQVSRGHPKVQGRCHRLCIFISSTRHQHSLVLSSVVNNSSSDSLSRLISCLVTIAPARGLLACAG